MDDDFDSVIKKPLKLTGSKKLRKNKNTDDPLAGVADQSKVIVIAETKAEQAFKSKQDKIAERRILRKAAKTHKQRVEEFNKHLDSLSEHYDIPKVSWTK